MEKTHEALAAPAEKGGCRCIACTCKNCSC